MKIILDAMGGDNAPDAVVRGALEAAKEFGVQIVLVGRGADILASMKAQGWDTLPDGVELANAEDVVDMHCDPAAVVKQHPNSSLVVGARMLAQGGGDAFISAGNTGALLTAVFLLAAPSALHFLGASGVLAGPSDEGRPRHSHRCGRECRVHAGIPAAVRLHGLVLRAEGARH